MLCPRAHRGRTAAAAALLFRRPVWQRPLSLFLQDTENEALKAPRDYKQSHHYAAQGVATQPSHAYLIFPHPHSRNLYPTTNLSKASRLHLRLQKSISHNGCTRELRPEATACADRLLPPHTGRVQLTVPQTTALPTRSPSLSSRTTLTPEASAQPGRAVSLYMAVNTEPPFGGTTATSNNREKKPLKSPGRPSIPPPQPTEQIKDNTTVPTPPLDSCSIPLPAPHTDRYSAAMDMLRCD